MNRIVTLTALLALTACCGTCPREPAAAPATTAAVAPATTQAAPAPEVAQAPVRRLSPTRITISVQNADLNEVMDQIGAQVGWNILVDPKVQETVTITLRDVPWREAVELIAKITRCDVVEIARR